MASRTGQAGQDRQNRIATTGWQDSTAGTDGQSRTSRIGQDYLSPSSLCYMILLLKCENIIDIYWFWTMNEKLDLYLTHTFSRPLCYTLSSGFELCNRVSNLGRQREEKARIRAFSFALCDVAFFALFALLRSFFFALVSAKKVRTPTSAYTEQYSCVAGGGGGCKNKACFATMFCPPCERWVISPGTQGGIRLLFD
jgi:hypothetical protein